MALIWSWVQRGAKIPFVGGVQTGAKALMVSMKWRYPNGGRLASRIEAGNTKGQARPFVRGQAAKGLCVSKPQRVGRWGYGESEVSPFGAARLNAFDAPTAKRDATGEVPHEMQNGLPCQDSPCFNFFAHANM